MNETPKDKKGWRMLRRILIGLAILATLEAIFYTEEAWRGRHAWNKYKQELEAKGEQLDLKAFIPKPVPDDQNFAATPFVKSWFDNVPENKQWRAKDNYSKKITDREITDRFSLLRSDNDRGDRHFVKLVAVAEAFEAIQAGRPDQPRKFDLNKLDLNSRIAAAPTVIKGLNDDEVYFTELRAASQRPYSRYPVVYNLDNPPGILVFQEPNVKAVCERLQLKACAELTASQNDQALADVKLMLHLADSLKEDPFLLSYLVRTACISIAIQPIWEGLAEHAWSDAQLQELQSRLQQYNFVADLKSPLGYELASHILTIDLTRNNGIHYWKDWKELDHRIAVLIDLIAPSGWYYQEELNYCRLFHTLLGPDLDPTTTKISPGQVKSRTREFEQDMGSSGLFSRCIHHRIFSELLLPALVRVPIKTAITQTTVNQAALACALERYRLANGQFPKTLEALVPRFIPQLPNDVISGEPYKYHLTNDGQFVLYSIGWNEKDDGGVPGKTLFDEKEGDWVWQYPLK